MARKQNDQKRSLQGHVRKLKNEIEELKREREEERKSKMYYKYEAENAHIELQKAKEMIEVLERKNTWPLSEPTLVQSHAAQAGIETKDMALQKLELETRLEQISKQNREWQEKYDDLYTVHMGYEIQIKEIEQAKTREIQLRALNNILKTEITKIKQAHDEALNIEYLKNVVIKFLEMKTTRPQLVPILSALLNCTHEDKTKLHQIVHTVSPP